MKKLLLITGIITIIASVFFVSLFALNLEKAAPENDQVKKVIQDAYVNGIHNVKDLSQIQKGFHPGFEMLSVRDNRLNKFPIYSWYQLAKSLKEKNPDGVKPEKRCEIVFVDISGKTASVKIKLFAGDKHAYDDYFFLYKFEEGWRIVAKAYNRMP